MTSSHLAQARSSWVLRKYPWDLLPPPYVIPHDQNTSNLAKGTHGELQSCLIFWGLLYASYQVCPFTWVSSSGTPGTSKMALHSPVCSHRVGDSHWHACSAVGALALLILWVTATRQNQIGLWRKAGTKYWDSDSTALGTEIELWVVLSHHRDIILAISFPGRHHTFLWLGKSMWNGCLCTEQPASSASHSYFQQVFCINMKFWPHFTLAFHVCPQAQTH